MKTIVEIALVTLSFVIIVGLLTVLFSQSEGKAAEELCHTFNALIVKGGETAEELKAWGAIPDACKVLERENLPTEYTADKEGAMRQVGDLASKCWWMFMEGAPGVDILGNDLWGLGGAKCFICYTFNFQKGVNFNSQELELFFDTKSYTVRDESDQCSALGGGHCAAKCENVFSREVESKKCSTQKCCVAEDKRDECINKGGQCLESCSGLYTKAYPNWQCAKNNCCIKPENFYTYRDYIQRFGGRGYLHVQPNLNFNSQGTYALVFNEDPERVGFIKDLVLPPKIEVDSMIITELNQVQGICAIQPGAVG